MKRQIFLFSVVGLSCTILGYGGYLLIVSVGIDHKIAITIIYPISISLRYILNRNWTFRHRGRMITSIPRFIAAYLLCYVLNLLILCLFVDQAGFSPKGVQAAAIVFLAFVMFLLNRYFVFSAYSGKPTAGFTACGS